MPLDPRELIAFLIAISFAAGLNVSGTVALLGLLARAGVLTLPGDLGMVMSWWVIGGASLLFVIEVVADKVPLLDLIWNVLQTFVRVPAAAVIAYAATPSLDPGWQLAATVLGAGLALLAHTLKTTMRTAVSASPEPASNIALSVTEDLLALGLTWFAASYPWLAAALVGVLIVMAVVIIRLLWRAARRLLRTS
ncbi:MAG: DUF4126 domain-containing protein [Acidobacteria bacterium]|nr:DUF4126 domain-containing protein [Acidobacteriota bacterium]